MLRGNDILCFSSIDWDFIWQGHQQIMASLAREGNRVLFIENTGVRAPRLSDLPRLSKRVRNWLRGTKGFRQVMDNLVIYSPIILPFPYSRLARWVNRWLLMRALQRWMRVTGFRRPLVWTFLPTPLVCDLVRELDPELVIYYCIDDLASSSAAARRITRSETQLFRLADLVFVTSEKLRERARAFTPRVHLFPFGVDFEKFDRVRQNPDQVPEEVRALPRPVIGYIGGIHQWVDQGLLADAAARMPDASFVLVGPAQTDVSRLARQRNVHLLGARSHEELPRYVKGFTVGMVPYRLSEYTAHVYPTKLNEYLAMGIPVVTTDLPEMRRFNAEHGPVVSIAKNVDQFVEEVRAALGRGSASEVAQRVETARQNSWAMRLESMSGLIEQELDRRRGEHGYWQDRLRRLYLTARRQGLSWLVAICAAYWILFRSPLLWLVAKPLRLAELPRPTDAIVVLAGGVGETGKAGSGGGYQERVKEAVDLYRDGMAPQIVFVSGFTYVLREAEVMRDLAISLGVPDSAVLIETQAANTHWGAMAVATLLSERGWHSILLVSSPYHMRRAMLTFRKAAPEVMIVPKPVTRSQFYAHAEGGARLEQVRAILQEYIAIAYYWWKGWL